MLRENKRFFSSFSTMCILKILWCPLNTMNKEKYMRHTSNKTKLEKWSAYTLKDNKIPKKGKNKIRKWKVPCKKKE